MSGGVWKKSEDVFAERFEFPDIDPLLAAGLNVQESQLAILIRGGAVIETLVPGFYRKEDVDTEASAENGRRSLVMGDNSEFALPLCVEALRTSAKYGRFSLELQSAWLFRQIISRAKKMASVFSDFGGLREGLAVAGWFGIFLYNVVIRKIRYSLEIRHAAR